MKLYIAGRFHQQEEIREIMEKARRGGHEVTEDWTRHKAIDSFRGAGSIGEVRRGRR